jgi:pimeloyl-ACP methyl ester carboxylesterase
MIADYHKGQSLIETLLANGLGHVALTDWKSATDDMKDFNIDNYLAELIVAIDDLGERVNLVGLCQGGWLSAMAAARFPEKVNALVLAGSPIDTDAGAGSIKRMAHQSPHGKKESTGEARESDGGKAPSAESLLLPASRYEGRAGYGRVCELTDRSSSCSTPARPTSRRSYGRARVAPPVAPGRMAAEYSSELMRIELSWTRFEREHQTQRGAPPANREHSPSARARRANGPRGSGERRSGRCALRQDWQRDNGLPRDTPCHHPRCLRGDREAAPGRHGRGGLVARPCGRGRAVF